MDSSAFPWSFLFNNTKKPPSLWQLRRLGIYLSVHIDFYTSTVPLADFVAAINEYLLKAAI